MSYGLVRRLSESARSSVVETREVSARPLRLADLQPGWAVIDVAGRSVGRLSRVTDRGLVVARGIGRGHTIVSPHHVAELHHGEVRLNLRKQELP